MLFPEAISNRVPKLNLDIVKLVFNLIIADLQEITEPLSSLAPAANKIQHGNLSLDNV